MMPKHMLMLSAALTHCRIDHHVKGFLSHLGSILSFEGSAYTCIEQGIYEVFMTAKRMHPKKIEKFMYDLHQEELGKMRKCLGISLPFKALNIYVLSVDDLSVDRDSLCPEEAPYAGPSNYLHFNQLLPLLYLQMGHLETPYPDIPGRYSPTAHFSPSHYNIPDSHQQPPVEDEVLADPYYYLQDQCTQPSYPQPPMLGGIVLL
ncbi:hypothetical protein BDR06DRAFT_955272, partial [Suillus hirtellus]